MNDRSSVKGKILRVLPSLLFFVFISYIIIQVDSGSSDMWLEFSKGIRYSDKIGHFTLYGVMALLLNFSFNFQKMTVKGIRFYSGSIIVLTFAVTEELTQLFFENRTFDFYDILFDFLGIKVFNQNGFGIKLIQKIDW